MSNEVAQTPAETGDGQVQQESKRRRRSGWDVQVPITAAVATPATSSSTAASSTGPFVPDEAYIQQQAQQALLAQQQALQKAHQMIAQQAIQKTFASGIGGMTQLSKPGCRIYIG